MLTLISQEQKMSPMVKVQVTFKKLRVFMQSRRTNGLPGDRA